MAGRGQAGVVRAWRIEADAPGEFVEIAETVGRRRVAVAVIRGDTTARVWFTQDAWKALTDLAYGGPEVAEPQEGREVQDA